MAWFFGPEGALVSGYRIRRSWRGMSSGQRRKCRCCKQLFVPEARNRRHQRYCTAPSCQKARKEAGQKRWQARPANRDYWRGEWNAARVRQWQKAHPGYWKKRRKKVVPVLQVVCAEQTSAVLRDKPEVLQDVWTTQPPILLGLISRITGTVLQDDMARVTGQLIASGRALVGPQL